LGCQRTSRDGLGEGKTPCLPVANPVAARLVLYGRLTSYEFINFRHFSSL
jgi:hypothetical protein